MSVISKQNCARPRNILTNILSNDFDWCEKKILMKFTQNDKFSDETKQIFTPLDWEAHLKKAFIMYDGSNQKLSNSVLTYLQRQPAVDENFPIIKFSVWTKLLLNRTESFNNSLNTLAGAEDSII